MMFVCRATALAVLVAVAAARADAVVLRVPEDYGTVLSAVDAASSGDTVLVGPGVWTDRETRGVQICPNFLQRTSVAFLKPGITVRSVAGPGATILDGGPAGGALVITLLHVAAGTATTRVEGFTITGGGVGVMLGCTDSRLELVNCHINENRLLGVSVGPGEVAVIDCEVQGNVGEDNAAAVSFGDDATIEMIRTRFQGNEFGAVDLQFGANRIVIEDCEFLDHRGRRAVFLEGCPDVQIRRSRFLRNTYTIVNATVGAGALRLDDCSGVVEFCTFAYDSATTHHAGAMTVLEGSAVELRNNTFFGCYALGHGAALAVGDQSTVEFSRNIVAECNGLSAVRQTSTFTGTVVSDCNNYWGNAVMDFSNWDPAPTDLFEDPVFCDPAALDFTLSSKSPCLPPQSGACGLIGAFGEGCRTVAIEKRSWGAIKGRYLQPRRP